MGRSLTVRLLLGAALWLVVALAGSWIVLTGLFEDHLRQQMVAELDSHLNQLIANFVIDADGTLTGVRPLSDPRFVRPYSGLYWQVENEGAGRALRSRSLWDVALALPPDQLADGERHRHDLHGPNGSTVFVLEQTVRPAMGGSARVAVGLDLVRLEQPFDRFGRALALSLGVIGVGILLAAVAQVFLGLRPLARLRRSLADVRAGAVRRIDGRWPGEVEPLVADFNSVLEHDAAVLQRAREQAGNLAHALKTPLSVLLNRVRTLEGPLREELEGDLAEIDRQVRRRLAHARTAGGPGGLGLVTPVRERLNALRRTILRAYPDRTLALEITVPEGLHAPCDRQDFDEVAGNLLDNAAKWAAGRILATAQSANGWFTLIIADDGPGLPAAVRDAVFERGRRLDERIQGSGLGLAIVRDIVSLYGGDVTLGESVWGGVEVVVHLPLLWPAPLQGSRL